MPSAEDKMMLRDCINKLNEIADMVQAHSDGFDYDMLVNLGSGIALLYKAVGLLAVAHKLDHGENWNLRAFLQDSHRMALMHTNDVESNDFVRDLINSIDGISGSDAEE